MSFHEGTALARSAGERSRPAPATASNGARDVEATAVRAKRGSGPVADSGLRHRGGSRKCATATRGTRATIRTFGGFLGR
ncbi:hypothetical protein GCM10011390_17140 [Aureimonas endophytica]|uniref:Uncharacterized protein n=1 Tax=Aureimonas endophytica TaxID=2027858 RepID=A0A917E338_9HYPH|nr:hypothetical protein [Aureimonas endophytica]GGD98906.1 hypothetical protein GCM10011390_17140 [Aureimonas endophytica]